jgi:hypothetical protein
MKRALLASTLLGIVACADLEQPEGARGDEASDQLPAGNGPYELKFAFERAGTAGHSEKVDATAWLAGYPSTDARGRIEISRTFEGLTVKVGYYATSAERPDLTLVDFTFDGPGDTGCYNSVYLDLPTTPYLLQTCDLGDTYAKVVFSNLGIEW